METKRIAILFSGNGSNLEALIKSLHKKCFLPSKRPENIKQSTIGGFLIGDVLIEGFLIGGLAHTFKIIEPDCAKGKHSNKAFKVEVVLALSNKSDAFGLTRAKRLGIATEVIENAGKTREEFDAQLITTLQEFKLDLCVLAGFMRILTPILRKRFALSISTPHFCPFQRRARNLRILQLTYAPRRCERALCQRKLDSGEIIAQGAITKIAGESLESYEARIHKLEHTLYPLALLEALTRKK